jgi:hypothetical protein
MILTPATGKGRIANGFGSEPEFAGAKKSSPEIPLNQGFRANSGAKSLS